jgi:hypothetical protein
MATYGTFVDATTLKASEANDFFRTQTSSPVAKQVVSLSGSGSNRFFVVNKTVFWNFVITISSSGTASNAITVDFPVASSSDSFRAIGFGYYFDSSDNIKLVSVVKASSTTVQFMTDAGTSLTNRLGINPAITAANGDVIVFNCIYEAA